MTLLDTCLHEYGAGFSQEAIRGALAVPLSIAFALYAAIGARYDLAPAGPTYQDRELLKALEGVQRAEKEARRKERRRR